jgi:hypothetical protein
MGERSDTRYFGKVCEKHPELAGERFVSSRCCLDCRRESARRAYCADSKRHYKSDPEASRRYRALHPERSAAACRRWQKANPEKMIAQNALRRARKKDAAVPLTAEEKARITALYKEAQRLTRETGEQYHVDHDRPLARGGKHRPENLIVVPARFNLKKGDKYDSMWDFISS